MAIFKPPYGARLDLDHPLSQGLVGCWLLNERSGNNIYNLTHMTMLGSSTSPVWTPDGIEVSGAGNRFLAGSIDYTTWSSISIVTKVFHASVFSGNQFILSNYSDGYYLDTYDGTLEFKLDSNVTASTSLARSTWYTIGASYDGAQIKLFTNGKNVASGSSTWTYSKTSTDTYIGARSNSDDLQWGGLIAFAYIYDRVLSESEFEWLHAEPYSMIFQPQYWYMVDFGVIGSSNLKSIGGIDLTNVGSIGSVPIGDIKKIGDENI